MALAEGVRFVVQGRVQGVGFRKFVQKLALRLDLSGWAANTEDGDLEVVVSGDDDQLAELEDALQRGPKLARVDQVLRESHSADALPYPFEIHR